MATQATAEPVRTGFEKWQDSINEAVKDARWNAWDCEIRIALSEYNLHLKSTPGYQPLDWRLIKAMLWVESGAHSPAWKTRPMQIGNIGDPGMAALLSNKDGGDLILPPKLREHLTAERIRTIPSYNIRAGIGYLLMRLANYEYRSILDADRKIYEVTIKQGDSLTKIADTYNSTIEALRKLNPEIATGHHIRPGQILKYQKASIKRVITGWKIVSTELVAEKYNGVGDLIYLKKLDYVLSILGK